MDTDIDRARALIESASSVTILTHTRPDGDAVASSLALFHGLNEIGKSVSPILSDPLPPRFSTLPGADRIERALSGDDSLLVALDCADLGRISLAKDKIPSVVDINIDHHPTNPHFGRVNFIDPKAVSTTQILYRIMPQLGLPITIDVASNLMAGLITDTIGFRTENVSPQTFIMAAELLNLGIPHADIYQKSLTEQSFPAVKYWGCGLSNLRREDSLVWTDLSLEDRESVGYEGVDDADLTNLLSAIEGVRVAVIFVEQPDGKVKVSFRSRDGFDVATLAAEFDGGGHTSAAGAMIEGSMGEIIERVLSATRHSVFATSERGV